MYENLKVVLTTSVSPWHPSAIPTIRSVHAIWQVLGTVFIPIHFYCDYPPDYITEEEREAYWKYLDALRGLDIGPVILAPEWVGLVGLYRMIISELDTPVVMNWQHDWICKKPERVDAPRIVHCVANEPRVQMVRFSKRWIHPKPIDSFQIPWDSSVFGIPLIATNGWGDSPHFASAWHYHNMVLPRLAQYKGPCGRFGIEGPVLKSYRHNIKRLGFTFAQQKWGTWLYGRQGDERYILHIGRSAVRWRERKGVPHFRGIFIRQAGRYRHHEKCVEQSNRSGMVRAETAVASQDVPLRVEAHS